MTEPYEDAELDESVFVSGLGNMTLGKAVRRFVRAREDGLTISLYRREDKSPNVLDEVDVERLATLKRFRVLRE